MKKRILKLIALTLVVLTSFSVVGCDMDALFAPLTEIQPEVPSGMGNSHDDTMLVTDDAEKTYIWTESLVIIPPGCGLDFEGENVVVLVPDLREAALSWNPSPEETILNEFVLMKNAAVSENLNIEISFEFFNYPDSEVGKLNFLNVILDDVTQDLHYYDIVTAPSTVLTDAMIRDSLANLFDNECFPYFDFSLPCWNQSLVNECTVNNRLYLMSGANEYSSLLDSYVVWHNKTLYDEKKEATDHESMMELAREGQWTYDELYRWAARLYEDSNGVAGKQIDDTYGVGIMGSGDYPCADAFRGAWEAQLTLNVGGDFFNLNNLANNRRVEDTVERVKALYKTAEGSRVNAGKNEFMAGHYIFAIDTLDSLANVSDTNDVIELLPMPKFDVDQAEYKSLSANPIVSVALDHSESTKITKGEAISAVLELCCEEMYLGIFLNLDSQLPIEIDEAALWTIKQTFENTQMRAEDIYSSQLLDLGNIMQEALLHDQTVSSVYLSRENNYFDAKNKLHEWFGIKG
jgi:hypothetical protein